MTEVNMMVIRQGNNTTRRSAETLSETNDLTIGQTFLSIADFYGKCKDDYPRWISYDKNRSEFEIIKERVEECANDLEKVHLVCDWLGEEAFS